LNYAPAALHQSLLQEFAAAFPQNSAGIHVFRAPGRVNLIGEHTDYNDGFVMPAAISFDVRVACARNDSGQLVVRSLQQNDVARFPVHDPVARPKRDWTDYVRGVLIQLTGAGYAISGADVLIDGQVPMSAGLSSSAALEVASALALLDTTETTPDPISLARLCQRAENEFVGARCGIMDQFASATGRAGHAILLDCRSLESSYVPLPPNIAIVICNTQVKHSIAGGEYSKRRAECEECVRYFERIWPGISSLRDVTENDLREHADGLPDVLVRRCRHVIRENARVLATARALQTGDLQTVGQLMYESHASLRDDYEVSCPELDLMVDLAGSTAGTYGCRMTGGGFGGCTVTLVEKSSADAFRTRIKDGYQRVTGVCPDIYLPDIADGAGPAS
jgi:galactokinase